MLIRVIRFFVTVLLAVIGGVILHLASPVLTELISTEVLKTEMGLYKLTMANVILIGIGMVVGGIAGYLVSPYFVAKLQKFLSGLKDSSARCLCRMLLLALLVWPLDL
mgnify:CR=1 FL=1